MSVSSSNSNEVREKYAITIVPLVLAWYNNIAHELTDFRVDVRVCNQHRNFGGRNGWGKWGEILENAIEIEENIHMIARSYMIRNDKGRVLTVNDVRGLVNRPPRPPSEEGNQIIIDDCLAWAYQSAEALTMIFDSLEGIMIGNRWFDLKTGMRIIPTETLQEETKRPEERTYPGKLKAEERMD